MKHRHGAHEFLRVIPRSCMLQHKKIDKNTAHNSLFLHACCNIEIKKNMIDRYTCVRVIMLKTLLKKHCLFKHFDIFIYQHDLSNDCLFKRHNA